MSANDNTLTAAIFIPVAVTILTAIRPRSGGSNGADLIAWGFSFHVSVVSYHSCITLTAVPASLARSSMASASSCSPVTVIWVVWLMWAMLPSSRRFDSSRSRCTRSASGSLGLTAVLMLRVSCQCLVGGCGGGGGGGVTHVHESSGFPHVWQDDGWHVHTSSGWLQLGQDG